MAWYGGNHDGSSSGTWNMDMGTAGQEKYNGRDINGMKKMDMAEV